jgi:hypothetical protein
VSWMFSPERDHSDFRSSFRNRNFY